jgi:SNF2 family DNA or RNA helicase
MFLFISQKFAAAGTIKQNYANILVLLLRLRQACDHPFLLKEDNHANLTNPGSIEMAKQLPREILTNLLEKLEERHPICSICAVSIPFTQHLFLNHFAFSLIKIEK